MRVSRVAHWEQQQFVREVQKHLPRFFKQRLDMKLHFSSYFFRENVFHKDLYFVGLKRGPSPVAEIETIAKLRMAVSKIRKEWQLTPAQVAGGYFRHAMKMLFSILLGERRLHDLRFNLRHRSRALAIKLVGEERYVQRSRQRRERGKRRRRIVGSSDSA